VVVEAPVLVVQEDEERLRPTLFVGSYGDITPKSRGAKVVTELEALTGVVLIVVAFGFAVGVLPKTYRKASEP